MTKITTRHVAVISAPERRALAFLAASLCPSDSWPRAILTIGLDSIIEALNAPAAAAYWIEPNTAADFLQAQAVRAYIANGVPIVALCRSYADASAIAATLGRAAA